MPNAKSISVIIPAYKEEKYIAQTIKSVLRQTEKSEIIVVVTKSDDRTSDISRSFKEVKVVETSKRGVSNARNIGAENSKGDILIFLDADTCLHEKDLLKNIKNTFTSEYSVGTCLLKFDSSLSLRFTAWVKNKILAYFGGSNQIIISRRKIFDNVGGFKHNLAYGETGDFIRSARRLGKYRIFNSHVVTSPRRYEKWGVLGCALFGIYGYMKIHILNRNVQYVAVR